MMYLANLFMPAVGSVAVRLCSTLAQSATEQYEPQLQIGSSRTEVAEGPGAG